MKRILLTILIATFASGAVASSRDFWTVYGEHLAYNYAVKAGTGIEIPVNHRLTSDETASVVTKSFSQSMGVRLTEVAWNKRGAAVICIFSPEPERCYVDVVMQSLFDEVQIINAPGFSQKFLKKLRGLHSGTFTDRFSTRGKRKRSNLVPPWKKFNPQYGLTLNDAELVVATPFYTFLGVYVEPQWGTIKGFSLGLMKHPWYVDFCEEGLSLKYRLPGGITRNNRITISLRPGKEIVIENALIHW